LKPFWQQAIDRPRAARWAVAGLCIAAGFDLARVLAPHFHFEVLFVPFLGAVLVATRYGGLWPGVAVLVGSLLLADYFFIPPIHSFGSYGSSGSIIILLFAFTALIGLLLMEASRRAEWRARAALRSNDERLHCILESAKDYAIFAFDTHENIITWSEGASRIFGFSEEEALGRNVKMLRIDGEQETLIWRNDIDSAVRIGFARRQGWRVRKDGTRFFLSGMIWPMRDHANRLVGYTEIVQDATEGILFQESLRQSEARYRALSDATFDSVAIHENGIGLEVNQSFCEMFGYERDEVIGKYLPELLVAPESRELVLEQIRTGSTERYEAVLRKKNGTKFLTELRARNFTYEGHPVRVVSAHDITERRRMEAELRRNATVLARAQRIAHLGSWEIEFFNPANLDDCKVHWSDEVYRIYGYAPRAVSASKEIMCKAVHPGDRPAIMNALDKALHEGRPYTLEYSIIRADGSQRMVRSQTEALFDQEGQLKGLAGTLQDITEARLVDEAVRESQRFLQSVLDATPSEMAVLDESADIVVVNAAWRRFAEENGLTAPNHGVGLNYLKACQSAGGKMSEEGPVVGRAIQEMIAGERDSFFVEYSCHSAEAKRWFMVRLSRFSMAGAVRILCMHEDVTQLKLTQEDLEETKDQLTIYARGLEKRVEDRTTDLRQSLQSLEGFLYHVAHDLRAPLRATEGLVSLLLHEYAQAFDETGRDYAERIAAAATRMDLLIQDLLEYGRVSQANFPPRAVELEAHLENVVAQLGEAIRAKSAEVEVERPLPVVFGHPILIEQVLRNLLDNALKFAPVGVAPRIHIVTEQLKSTVRINIEDNCTEIGSENRERIFRVFERLPSETASPGTGIGLAIVRKAVQRMNGSVGVEPGSGKGNRFWFELPAGSEAPSDFNNLSKVLTSVS